MKRPHNLKLICLQPIEDHMAFYRQAAYVLGELRSFNGNTQLAGQRYELRL
jgi:hypothetical protein